MRYGSTVRVPGWGVMRGAGEDSAGQGGKPRRAEGWGSALWAETDPQLLVMYEEPRGEVRQPDISQAIMRWTWATDEKPRQEEAGGGRMGGAKSQERAPARRKGVQQGGGGAQRRGECRTRSSGSVECMQPSVLAS